MHERPAVDRIWLLAASLLSLFLSGCTSTEPFERFESGFSSPDWRQWWKVDDLEATVQLQPAADRTAGFEPALGGAAGNALRVTIAKGTNAGTHQLEYNFAEHGKQDPTSASVRYFLRFGRTFTPHQGGKFVGFAGTYGAAGYGPLISTGYNGWSTRGMFYPAAKGEPIRLASLCYLANMQERGGRSVFFDWHQRGIPRFERDRWYEIVQHVRMNTVEEGRGKPDGHLRVWVDGRLAVDQRDLVYRHTRDIAIDRMWLNVHYGGEPAPHDMHVFFDEIVIVAGGPGPLVRKAADPRLR